MCLKWSLTWGTSVWRWSRLLWVYWSSWTIGRQSLIIAGAVHIHTWCDPGVSDLWRHSDQFRRPEINHCKDEEHWPNYWENTLRDTIWGLIVTICSSFINRDFLGTQSSDSWSIWWRYQTWDSFALQSKESLNELSAWWDIIMPCFIWLCNDFIYI